MIKRTLFSVAVLATCAVFAQSTEDTVGTDSNALLSQYIKSKGFAIIFDASNIKQYWIDKSVMSQNGAVVIFLENSNSQINESVPLRIQLTNVDESQDCNIEIITNNENASFSVLNNKSKVLSTSKEENDFIDYHISSSQFHLENTPNFIFDLKFNSKTQDALYVKKILLSFSDNKDSNYLRSPGEIKFNQNLFQTTSTTTEIDKNSFSVTGKLSSILSLKKFFIKDNILTSSLKVKNIGEQACTVSIGFSAYTKDGIGLNGRNYPYIKTSSVLTVLSSQEGSDKVIVDSYPDWGKNCYLALNAKDDLSDIPNTTFADGKILEVKKMDDGKAEITLDKPLKSKLEEGTKVRVHGRSGAYLYTFNKRLQPGDEQIISSTIQKDDNFLEYSSKAFPRGTYYVVPIILSYSTDSNIENTILIQDFSIKY